MSVVAAAIADALQQATGKVLVGFSGGLDSTVLLHAAVAAGGHRRVTALHVNHRLHADADAWERHCARTAASLGVSLETRRVDVPRRGSLEAAARAARYAAFAAALPPEAQLWLAHHREDQAETVLLRLLQGRGLYGMPPQRPLGAGLLVRPLLDVARGELEAYASRQRLRWIDDPSNADLGIDRNFVRRRVLPVLRTRWPGVERALLAAAARSRLADQLLTHRMGNLAAVDALACDELASVGPDEQVELLRLWLAGRGYAAPRRAALLDFLRQLGAADDRNPELRLAGARLRRYRDRVLLIGPLPELAERYAVPDSGLLRLPHGELRVVRDDRGFEVQGALEVRFRQGGERLRRRGRQRTVKQILQEAGVPPWLRPAYPLLFDEAGLAAVPGLAQRDPAGAGAGRLRADWLPFG